MNLLDLFISPAYAQAAGAAQPSPWSLPIMLGVFFVVFYFFIIRPQSKRAKEHKSMLESLKKGDEVVTQGGIVGKVAKVGEGYVTVEIARSGDQPVEVNVQKAAVQVLLPNGTIKAI